ncbi:hypothetical protein TSAR_016197 [Trichomalopsis sarcophagae]|uniref:Uncharacterized protein n=1 Tax=Trichomalopsis sarcophagae TaxID=543379 RepID=A0A232EMY1_9HYME|nr:hypothetical protein TSAR_016197 [Trichomalopsis sarcophagae]
MDDDVINTHSLRHIQESVESGRSIYGFMKESVLTHLNHFNIISGFIPDSMHLIDLGIAKQFMKYWFDTKNMPYSLSNEEIHLMAIKVVRYCRSIRDRKFWKAKELQNWVLYYSTIVLLMIPKMRCYVERTLVEFKTRACTKVFKTDIGRYFGKVSLPKRRWIRELNLSESAIVYEKLVKQECSYLSCNKTRLRSNNSFAMTTDNNFIQIVFFIIDSLNRQEYTVCKSVNVTDIFDNNIIDEFQIKRIIGISEDLRTINTATISRICVHMSYDNESYLCPVPNMYSY